MQTSWLTFFVATQLSHSSVHFLPSAESVSAPYPVNATFSLFGSGIEPKSLILEGGRLSNPDGVRLEDLFPELKTSAATLFGLMLELSTPQQQRLALNGSGCVVEINSHGYQTRFLPTMIPGEDALEAIRNQRRTSLIREAPRDSVNSDCKCLIALKDAVFQTSLVLVNAEAGSLRAVNLNARTSGENVGNPVLGEIDGPGVIEISVTESLVKDSVLEQDCSWGRIQAGALNFSLERASQENLGPGNNAAGQDADKTPASDLGLAAAFVLYRDVNSRRIVAVESL